MFLAYIFRALLLGALLVPALSFSMQPQGQNQDDDDIQSFLNEFTDIISQNTATDQQPDSPTAAIRLPRRSAAQSNGSGARDSDSDLSPVIPNRSKRRSATESKAASERRKSSKRVSSTLVQDSSDDDFAATVTQKPNAAIPIATQVPTQSEPLQHLHYSHPQVAAAKQPDLKPIKQFDETRPEFKAPNLLKKNTFKGALAGAALVGIPVTATALQQNTPGWFKWTAIASGIGAIIGGLTGFAYSLYNPKIRSHELARNVSNGFNEFGCAAINDDKGTRAWREHYQSIPNPKDDPYLANEITTITPNKEEVIVNPLHVAAGNGSCEVLKDICRTLPPIDPRDEKYRVTISSRLSESENSSKSDSEESDDHSSSDTDSENENERSIKPKNSDWEEYFNHLPSYYSVGNTGNGIDKRSFIDLSNRKKHHTIILNHNTPLHWALLGNHTRAAAALLKYKACATLENNQKQTAQQILKEKNNSELFQSDRNLQTQIKKRKSLFKALFPHAR